MSDDVYDDERFKEASREVNEYTSLLNHVGWKRLISVFEDQIETRRNLYELVPLKTLDEALAQEFLKGENTGQRTLLAFPEQQMTIAKETIEQLTANEEETSDDDS